MYPTAFTAPAFQFDWAAATKPAADLWANLGAVYTQPLRDGGQDLWTSSLRIIQDHAVRAWVETSQACLGALAQNAATIQQRALFQLLGAHQAAAAVVTEQIASSAGAALNPASAAPALTSA